MPRLSSHNFFTKQVCSDSPFNGVNHNLLQEKYPALNLLECWQFWKKKKINVENVYFVIFLNSCSIGFVNFVTTSVE